MGYNIEVSFNLFKNNNVSELEKQVVSIAEDYHCDSHYKCYEMEKHLHSQRNHVVMNILFDEFKIFLFIHFLRDIKKIKGLFIESIYDDNINELLYASQYYLTIMDKNCAYNYKLNKRKRSYSEDDIMILKEVK